MSRAPRWEALCAAVAVLTACPSEATPRTELIVWVTSDLEVPEALNGLKVEVTAPSGRRFDKSVVLGPGGQGLPATLALEWVRGELEPLTATARGSLRGETRVTARAITGFVREQSILLELRLGAQCVGVECGEFGTCSEGSCKEAHVDQEDLPRWSGSVEVGGDWDASVDGGAEAAVDASVDVAQDAAPDGLVDAPPDAPVDAVPDAEDASPPDGGTLVPVQASCLSGAPGCGLVSIAGGAAFDMGEPEGAGCPAYQGCPVQAGVRVESFYIDRYEVTVGRFGRFLEAHEAVVSRVRYPNGTEVAFVYSAESPGVYRTGDDSQCNLGGAGRESHPMNCVDWATAQAFCVWDGGRLPTEGEWEYAARGTEGRIYPWGDEPVPTCGGGVTCGEQGLAQCGSCPGEDDAVTWPVGSFEGGATPEGVLDLAGNVWEWTADWFHAYPPTDTACSWAGVENPLCSAASPYRVVRGGSWAFLLRPCALRFATAGPPAFATTPSASAARGTGCRRVGGDCFGEG